MKFTAGYILSIIHVVVGRPTADLTYVSLSGLTLHCCVVAATGPYVFCQSSKLANGPGAGGSIIKLIIIG